jgi:dipeptidyl aminopeptidase/acylaminoacyl peptidase
MRFRALPTIAPPLLAFLLAPPLRAQLRAAEPLPIDDAFSIKTFQVYEGGPSFSPDSKWVASVVCDPSARAKDKAGTMTIMVATRGAAMYSFGCDIQLSPIDGSQQRNITGSIGNNWAPAWSPDGKTIAFYSDRGGAPHLWLWDRESGATRRASEAVVRTGVGTQRPQWLRDGSAIVVTLRPEGMTDAELDADLPPKAGEKVAPDANGSTVQVYRSGETGEGADKKGQGSGGVMVRYMSDLAKIDIRSGKATAIARKANALAPLLSPDGSQLMYFERKPGGGGTLIHPQDLVLVDVATGSRRVLAADVPTYEGVASWAPDGKRIAYLTASAAGSGTLTTGGSSQTRGTLVVIPAAGGEPRLFVPAEKTEGFDSDEQRPLWSEDGSALYVIGDNRVWRATLTDGRVTPLTKKPDVKITSIVPADNGRTAWTPPGGPIAITTSDPATLRSAFQVVAADGKLTGRLEEQKRYAVRFDMLRASPDGQFLVFNAESSAAPEDRWATTRDFTPPTRVTHLNPQVEKYPPGESRIIDFRNTDGEPLHAALFLPAGYEAGKRYPLIVLVYASGMGSRDVNSFGVDYMGEYNYQILTTRGYAILTPDIPVHTGTPMRDLMKSVMPAIDKVIQLGIADPDRLGVTGQSNGGYSTLALITQTNRFKAAVMNSGFGDLVGFYGSMNRTDGSGSWHPWLEKLGGAMQVPPWENPMRYVENSPIFYLDKIQTPLIIQAGADDEAIVPYSDQVFVALKRLDKNVTYLRYRDESHLLERHANKLDYWSRILPFWDKYLKGGSTP